MVVAQDRLPVTLLQPVARSVRVLDSACPGVGPKIDRLAGHCLGCLRQAARPLPKIVLPHSRYPLNSGYSCPPNAVANRLGKLPQPSGIRSCLAAPANPHIAASPPAIPHPPAQPVAAKSRPLHHSHSANSCSISATYA